jgi:hypothetical protein
LTITLLFDVDLEWLTTALVIDTKLEFTMSQDALQKVREMVGSLLEKPTDGLSYNELYDLVQEGIATERQLRDQAHGAGSTLKLNALLAIGGKRYGE